MKGHPEKVEAASSRFLGSTTCAGHGSTREAAGCRFYSERFAATAATRLLVLLALLVALGSPVAAQTGTPPNANAGPDQTVTPHTVVLLDGRRSSDPDGDPLTYSWAQVGSAPASVTLTDPTAAVARFRVPANLTGTYTFRLTADDGHGNQASDDVAVNVVAGEPVRLLFSSTRLGGNTRVFVADADGSNAMPLTDGTSSCWGGRWSPDRRRVLFVNGSALTLWVMNFDGTGLRQAAPDGKIGGATWHASGRRVAYTAVDYWTAPYGCLVRQCELGASSATTLLGDTSRQAISPEFSPDGRFVACKRWARYHCAPSTIEISNADGTGPRAVANLVNCDLPAWSPDGLSLTFVSCPCEQDYQSRNIWSVRTDGTGLTQLTNNDLAGFNQGGRFSPDGTRVLFTRKTSSGRHEVWSMNPDGTGQMLVCGSSGDDWFSDLGFALSPNYPPVADAGTPRSVTAGEATTLYGTLSYDPNGEPLSYRWTLVSGPSSSLLDPTSSVLGFSSVTGGTCVLRLTVNDARGLTATALTTVVVTTSGNQPPLAHAGPDQTVTPQTVVLLDARRSSDPEGDTLTYLWAQVGSLPATVTLTDPTAAIAKFRVPAALTGTYAFRLTVDDARGGRTADEVAVTVVGGEPVQFVAVERGSGDLVVLDLDGSGRRTLVSRATLAGGFPAWSPDRKTVAFAGPGEQPNTTRPWLVDRDGTGLRRAATNETIAQNRTVRWRATGRHLTYETEGPNEGYQTELHELELPTGQVRVLVPEFGRHIYCGNDVSPDGRRILFRHKQRYWEYDGKVDLLDLDGQNRRTQTEPAGMTHFWPFFHPDGRSFIFECNNSEDKNTLWSVDTDGSNLRQILPDQWNVHLARYSPDGTSLFFNGGPNCQMYRAAPDGSLVTEMTGLLLETCDPGFALSPNYPPVADAGRARSVAAGAIATVDGSLSHDPNGEPLTYSWSFARLPAGSLLTTASLLGATGPVAGFTPDAAGDYLLRLGIQDGRGLAASAVTTVIASGASTLGPEARFSWSGGATVGSVLTMDATGSLAARPEDQSRLAYRWELLSVPAGSTVSSASLFPAGAAVTRFVPDAIGNYEVRLTVLDPGGRSAFCSDTIAVRGLSPERADVDGDGHVNLFDVLAWRLQFQGGAPAAAADVNNDGVVSAADLRLVQRVRLGGTMSQGQAPTLTGLRIDPTDFAVSETQPVHVRLDRAGPAGISDAVFCLDYDPTAVRYLGFTAAGNPSAWVSETTTGRLSVVLTSNVTPPATLGSPLVSLDFQAVSQRASSSLVTFREQSVSTVEAGEQRFPDRSFALGCQSSTRLEIAGAVLSPASVAAGGSTALVVRVSNLGGRAASITQSAVYFSRSGILAVRDPGNPTSIPPGSEVSFAFAVAVSGSVAPGDVRVSFQVAGHDGTAAMSAYRAVETLVVRPASSLPAAVRLVRLALPVPLVAGQPFTAFAVLGNPSGAATAIVTSVRVSEPTALVSVTADVTPAIQVVGNQQAVVRLTGQTASASTTGTRRTTFQVSWAGSDTLQNSFAQTVLSSDVTLVSPNLLSGRRLLVAATATTAGQTASIPIWADGAGTRDIWAVQFELTFGTNPTAASGLEGANLPPGASLEVTAPSSGCLRFVLEGANLPRRGEIARLLLNPRADTWLDFQNIVALDANANPVVVSGHGGLVPVVGAAGQSGPDLAVSLGSVSATGAATGGLRAGASVEARVTVRNVGGTGTPGTFSVGLFLSPDPAVTSAARLLDTLLLAPLAAGEERGVDWRTNLPADATVGPGYLVVQADPGHVLGDPQPANDVDARPVVVEGALAGADRIIESVAGIGSGGPPGATTALNTRLSGPSGLATTSRVLYVAESTGHVVRAIDVDTGAVVTIAGTGSPGAGADGPGTQSALNTPVHLAVDRSGRLLISEQGSLIVRRWDPFSRRLARVAGSGAPGVPVDGAAALSARFSAPAGVAAGEGEDFFVADLLANRVYKVEGQTGLIRAVAGSGSAGSGVVTSGVGALTVTLRNPNGLAYHQGRLFIAESGANRVLALEAGAGTLQVWAGGGTPADGLGDGGQATAAALDYPVGVALTPNGALLISDSGHARIRRVDPTTRFISTVAGTGQAGYSGDGGAPQRAALSYPSQLAIEGGDDFWFADRGNDRIRWVHAIGTDDHPNTAGLTAQGDTVPTTGAHVRAAIERPGDVDVFRFQAQDGQRYDVDTFLGTLSDTVLDVLDLDGTTVLATNDDFGGSLRSHVSEFRPAVKGTYYLRIRAYDGASTGSYQVAVGVIAALTVATATLPPGLLNAPYSTSLIAVGGTPPYRFQLVSGTLPLGLILSEGGLLAGTPREPGSFTFDVRVLDDSGASPPRLVTLRVGQQAVPLVFEPAQLTPGAVGQEYRYAFRATGGSAPHTWSCTSGLPRGLGVHPSTGVLSGTPVQSGGFTFSVTVRDAENVQAHRSFTLSILNRRLPRLTLEAFPSSSSGGSEVTVRLVLDNPGRIELTDVIYPIWFNPRLWCIRGAPRLLSPFDSEGNRVIHQRLVDGLLNLNLRSQGGFLDDGPLLEQEFTYQQLGIPPNPSAFFRPGDVDMEEMGSKLLLLPPVADAGLEQFANVRVLQAVPPRIAPTVASPLLPPVDSSGRPINKVDYVQLDGLASFDPNIRVERLSYVWRQTAGPPVQLSDPGAPTPTFVPVEGGLHRFGLQVSNGQQLSPTAVVDVLVRRDDCGPFADARVSKRGRLSMPDSPLMTFAVDEVVPLSGSLSGDLVEKRRGSLTYAWTQTEGPPVALSDRLTANPTFRPAQPGTYAFQLVVRDGLCESKPSEVRFLVLGAGDREPTLTLEALVAGTSTRGTGFPEQGFGREAVTLRVYVTPPPMVTLRATVKDPEVSRSPAQQLLSFRWEQLEGPPLSLESQTLPGADLVSERSFTPTTVGLHTVRCTVEEYGKDGRALGVRVAGRIRVISEDLGREVPEAVVEADKTLARPGSEILLDGSKSSRPAKAERRQSAPRLRYTWVQVQGSPVDQSNPYSSVSTFCAPTVPTTYVFQLYVSDGEHRGAPAASDPIVITDGNNLRRSELRLRRGWNILALPVDPSRDHLFTAEDVLQLLHGVVLVRAGTDGRFQTHLLGCGTPFPVRGGEAYLAFLDGTVQSYEFLGGSWGTSAFTRAVVKGFNLLSYPESDPAKIPPSLTSDWLHAQLGNGVVVRVNEQGRFEPWASGLPFPPFRLEAGQGYLVRAAQPLTLQLPRPGP